MSANARLRKKQQAAVAAAATSANSNGGNANQNGKKSQQATQKAASIADEPSNGDTGANNDSNDSHDNGNGNGITPITTTTSRTVKVTSSGAAVNGTITKQRKWALDEYGDRDIQGDMSVPVGFVRGWKSDNDEKSTSKISAADQKELVQKSAMAMATAPGKQLFMTAFMLYMSGNGLQIFSIMMLGMAFWQPLQKLLNVNQEFARYADSQVDLTMAKLTFIALNICGILLAAYKCHSLGLLPTLADLAPVPQVKQAIEFSTGGIARF